MNKKVIRLLAALLGLIILVVGYFLISKNVSETNEETGEEEEYLLGTDIMQETFAKFSFMSNGEELAFDHRDGDWYYTADESFVVDGEALSNLLSSLLTTKINRTIENPENISEYGFDKPTNVITYQSDGDYAGTITLGTVNQSTGDVYVYLDDDTSVVYTVDKALADSFGITLEDLRSEATE